ncbi:MAG: PIN domain-containing protein [Tannerella sp.]|jgi:predicted nucleic acid-binding protein|nr:PIN domain-containing protein [Tannerella sp.]
MNKTIALDTNILVYCHSNDEPDKQEKATSLFTFNPVVSTQVLSEYLNVVKRKLKLPKNEIMDVCLQNMEMCVLQPVSLATLKHARKLLDRYDFQLFDSIVVASALEANCHILYSEDLHNGLVVENRMKIINPFN